MSIMKVLLNEVHFINKVFKIFQVDSIHLISQLKAFIGESLKSKM